jgi:hypothetical protein
LKQRRSRRDLLLVALRHRDWDERDPIVLHHSFEVSSNSACHGRGAVNAARRDEDVVLLLEDWRSRAGGVTTTNGESSLMVCEMTFHGRLGVGNTRRKERSSSTTCSELSCESSVCLSETVRIGESLVIHVISSSANGRKQGMTRSMPDVSVMTKVSIAHVDTESRVTGEMEGRRSARWFLLIVSILLFLSDHLAVLVDIRLDVASLWIDNHDGSKLSDLG